MTLFLLVKNATPCETFFFLLRKEIGDLGQKGHQSLVG
jgi:hypothetical protein